MIDVYSTGYADEDVVEEAVGEVGTAYDFVVGITVLSALHLLLCKCTSC